MRAAESDKKTKAFAPRARRELLKAVAWIAEESPDAADGLFRGAIDAAKLIVANPMLARERAELASERFRFWSLRGYPYLLVLDTRYKPPVIVRFVHQARDLPAVLDDLEPS